jgi:hypothetical protein
MDREKAGIGAQQAVTDDDQLFTDAWWVGRGRKVAGKGGSLTLVVGE